MIRDREGMEVILESADSKQCNQPACACQAKFGFRPVCPAQTTQANVSHSQWWAILGFGGWAIFLGVATLEVLGETMAILAEGRAPTT